MSLPKARTVTRTTGAIYGLAGVTAAAPVLFMMPGIEERLGQQARFWGPHWKRNFSAVTPHLRSTAAMAEPATKRTLQVVEPTLKSAAQSADRNMQKVFGHPVVQRVTDPGNVKNILQAKK